MRGFGAVLRGGCRCGDGLVSGPDGVVRYDVRQHGKGWLGMHQDGSPDTEDSPWLRLSREDVRVWRLNAAGCALAGNLTGGAEEHVAAGDEARDEVYGNFTLIKVGKRKIDLPGNTRRGPSCALCMAI